MLLLQTAVKAECQSIPFFQVNCENLSSISLSTIPVYCPKLSSFDLQGMCFVTDHGFMPLTRSNNLKSLRLAEASITDSTLESVANGCGDKVMYMQFKILEAGGAFVKGLHVKNHQFSWEL